jgi:hypothetical protein
MWQPSGYTLLEALHHQQTVDDPNLAWYQSDMRSHFPSREIP